MKKCSILGSGQYGTIYAAKPSKSKSAKYKALPGLQVPIEVKNQDEKSGGTGVVREPLPLSGTKSDTGGKDREFAVKRNLIDKQVSFLGSIREADILKRLSGMPYIVDLKQVINDKTPFVEGKLSPLPNKKKRYYRDDTLFFVFERAVKNLEEYIEDGPDSYQAIRVLILHMLLGLNYMHKKGVIHRDLKPANMLLFQEPDPESLTLKICDFGLAEWYTFQGYQTGGVVTSWYRAPEVVLEFQHYDYAVDVWAAACIAWQMATRHILVPVTEDDTDASSLWAILSIIPRDFDAKSLIKYCNVKDEEFLDVLQRPIPRKSMLQRLEKCMPLEFQEEAKALHPDEMKTFADFLENMLEFDPRKRWTAEQLLSHPFLANFKESINFVTEKFIPYPIGRQPVLLVDCIERTWMFQVAESIYKSRASQSWYDHRILFQSIDLFDRYLASIAGTAKPIKESEFVGRLLNKKEAYLKYLACVYIAIKYFNVLRASFPVKEILPVEYRNKESLQIIEKFEAELLEKTFNWKIYHQTPYEAADLYGDTLVSDDIKQLLYFIGEYKFKDLADRKELKEGKEGVLKEEGKGQTSIIFVSATSPVISSVVEGKDELNEKSDETEGKDSSVPQMITLGKKKILLRRKKVDSKENKDGKKGKEGKEGGVRAEKEGEKKSDNDVEKLKKGVWKTAILCTGEDLYGSYKRWCVKQAALDEKEKEKEKRQSEKGPNGASEAKKNKKKKKNKKDKKLAGNGTGKADEVEQEKEAQVMKNLGTLNLGRVAEQGGNLLGTTEKGDVEERPQLIRPDLHGK